MKASVRRLNDSVARLSSGSRIINPADDAAGLAVTTKFTTKTHRIDAVRNSLANTLSFVQTADGYLQKIAKALTRMGELAALAKDGTKSETDLEVVQVSIEVSQVNGGGENTAPSTATDMVVLVISELENEKL